MRREKMTLRAFIDSINSQFPDGCNKGFHLAEWTALAGGIPSRAIRKIARNSDEAIFIQYLLYWFSPATSNDQHAIDIAERTMRAQRIIKGHLVVAKTHAEWAEEIVCMTERKVRTVITNLANRSILIVQPARSPFHPNADGTWKTVTNLRFNYSVLYDLIRSAMEAEKPVVEVPTPDWYIEEDRLTEIVNPEDESGVIDNNRQSQLSAENVNGKISLISSEEFKKDSSPDFPHIETGASPPEKIPTRDEIVTPQHTDLQTHRNAPNQSNVELWVLNITGASSIAKTYMKRLNGSVIFFHPYKQKTYDAAPSPMELFDRTPLYREWLEAWILPYRHEQMGEKITPKNVSDWMRNYRNFVDWCFWKHPDEYRLLPFR